MISQLLSVLGFLFLLYRLWPRKGMLLEAVSPWPLVSIVVPARNEAANIERLLLSLQQLDYPSYEVIVLDDCSEDDTFERIKKFPVKAIRGLPKPEGWQGKNWACQQAVEHAKGEFLLFTDADTEHQENSLKHAVAAILAEEADGLSAFPYHRCEYFWEKLCGPFYLLLLAVTAPYSKPLKGRVFAIGQYLLFRRTFYFGMGAHEAVKDRVAEDIALAHRLLDKQGRWAVYRGPALYSVRMYENLNAFLRGWKRIFRAGLKESRWSASLEVTMYIAALTASFQLSAATLAIMILSLIFLSSLQGRHGNFSGWSALFFPWPLALFVGLTAAAAWDRAFNRPVIWKNRSC